MSISRSSNATKETNWNVYVCKCSASKSVFMMIRMIAVMFQALQVSRQSSSCSVGTGSAHGKIFYWRLISSILRSLTGWRDLQITSTFTPSSMAQCSSDRVPRNPRAPQSIFRVPRSDFQIGWLGFHSMPRDGFGALYVFSKHAPLLWNHSAHFVPSICLNEIRVFILATGADFVGIDSTLSS